MSRFSFVKKLVDRVIDKLQSIFGSHSDSEETGGDVTPPTPPSVPTPVPTPAPVQNEDKIDWCWGGFKGSGAKVDNTCVLSGLSAGNDKIAFKWVTNIPSNWARKSTEKGNLVIFAVFVRSGDGWKGGKVDWIDENRSSRSTENIKDGYNGWSFESYKSAKEVAICVCSIDGKFRSPLLVAKR